MFLFGAFRFRGGAVAGAVGTSGPQRARERNLFPGLLFPFGATAPADPQDAGRAETEFFGNGVAITVVVHDPSGNPVASAAAVRLYRGSDIPAGQSQTSMGVAEFVVNYLGEFTVVVEAAGYPKAQKEFSVVATSIKKMDGYLARRTNEKGKPPPGRRLLAPKA